ncbi:hypothetical protein CBUD_0792 [Coxiella burnetii Dugway 5J108-111]|uniref:Uncharacterized protein n=1 Tax=Coxiella burnetii (strain Dugway 5J108-111) TaxID=434922 RepID=A9KDW1_COXBN|nr:hypothetical protein CBUD_0792 [Coxiella burnetii Dugway 5J108-111]
MRWVPACAGTTRSGDDGLLVILTVFQKHYADTLSRKQIPTIGMFSETSSESEQKSLGHPLTGRFHQSSN